MMARKSKERSKGSRSGRAGRKDGRGLRRSRLFLVSAFFGCLALAVVAKLFFIQVLSHGDLSQRARVQYQKSIYLTPGRGTIMDRRGRELAHNVESFSIYADLSNLEDRGRSARLLSRELTAPTGTLLKKLEGEKGFVWLKRQVPPKEAQGVKSLDLKGVGLITESRRFYPQKDLASQIVGFAGVDSQGLEGIEYAYDRYLKGNAGWLIVHRDAKNRPVYVEGYQDDPENRGYDVTLAIDQNIQYFAQEEIRSAVLKTGAKKGLLMVMEPRTGEILAMALSTYFNPNNRSSFKSSQYRNVCITDVYEPGSTMKPFILAAALEQGLVSGEDIIPCGNGSIVVGGRTIRDIHSYEELTAREVIVFSSNVGAINIGLSLPPEDYYRWMIHFGFGVETGVDLPGESDGLIREPSEWSGLSQASMSIGQEVGVTPLQLLCGYAAFADDGLIHRPRIVRSISRDGRPFKVFPPEILRRAVTPRTASLVKSILREVVERGTGRAAAIPGYTAAGKTGTAQKFDASEGQYSREKYLSSFVGFTPVDDPAVVILVMLDEPEGAYYGGSVAAPVFSRVGRRILEYLAVPPDNPDDGLNTVDKGTGRLVNAG
jgi:cell division protein FtsI (penicillin-binding protein 3)